MKKRKQVLLVVATLLLGACSPHEIINAYFPNDSQTAHRVVSCESEYDVNAVSPTNDHGLFQINEPTWNKPGHSDPVADWIGRYWHKRYDPIYNSYMAKLIVDTYGWKMWSCY